MPTGHCCTCAVPRPASGVPYLPRSAWCNPGGDRGGQLTLPLTLTLTQVAIAVVNTSNRLARGRMSEDKVDRRHSIWVLAEGTRLATQPHPYPNPYPCSYPYPSPSPSPNPSPYPNPNSKP